jgi:hypothetical protein
VNDATGFAITGFLGSGDTTGFFDALADLVLVFFGFGF